MKISKRGLKKKNMIFFKKLSINEKMLFKDININLNKSTMHCKEKESDKNEGFKSKEEMVQNNNFIEEQSKNKAKIESSLFNENKVDLQVNVIQDKTSVKTLLKGNDNSNILELDNRIPKELNDLNKIEVEIKPENKSDDSIVKKKPIEEDSNQIKILEKVALEKHSLDILKDIEKTELNKQLDINLNDKEVIQIQN